MGFVLSAEIARDTRDLRRMAHNLATTDNVSARQYVATTKRNRRSEADQRRFTRGFLPCAGRMTCTDDTADRA